MSMEPMNDTVLDELIAEASEKKITTHDQLHRLKNKYLEKYKRSSILNIDLIEAYRNLLKQDAIENAPDLIKLLTKRSVRSSSGIVAITVSMKPFICYAQCIFCPGEPGVPKSYLSNEPAVMRALHNDFDPYRQVHNRLRSLEITGHVIDKVELHVIGGTFSYYPPQYQTWFVKQCLHALNTYYETKEQFETIRIDGLEATQFTTKTSNIGKIRPVLSLVSVKAENETSRVRCVGMTLETRPSSLNKREIERMRMLGCTRVEIGVQTIYDDILKLNKRGHTIASVVKATKMLRDNGFKITYHLMPNLLGSTIEKDLSMFRAIFSDSRFCPDQIKLYPCVVTEYSELTEIWKRGEYQPYTDEELTELIVAMKQFVPPWVRIIRIIRDIPKESILGGSTTSNLRQVIEQRLKENNTSCRCIRCREVKDKLYDTDTVCMERVYSVAGSLEYFLSIEDRKTDTILAFLRLYIPTSPVSSIVFPELQESGIIREVHTYGHQLAIGSVNTESSQHKGLGKKLTYRAEAIARSHGLKKMAVISAVGVREYYYKLGYLRDEGKGEYVVKDLG